MMPGEELHLHSRQQAGRTLAARLMEYADRDDVVVLALPNGGVLVGIQIATQLRTPLGVWHVRYVSTPGRQYVAFGAVTMGGLQFVDHPLVSRFGISETEIETALRSATTELEVRKRFYAPGNHLPDIKNKIVILADDGIIAASAMALACRAVRLAGARQVIVAVPAIMRLNRARLEQTGARVLCSIDLDSYVPFDCWYDTKRPTDSEALQTLKEFNARDSALFQPHAASASTSSKTEVLHG